MFAKKNRMIRWNSLSKFRLFFVKYDNIFHVFWKIMKGNSWIFSDACTLRKIRSSITCILSSYNKQKSFGKNQLIGTVSVIASYLLWKDGNPKLQWYPFKGWLIKYELYIFSQKLTIFVKKINVIFHISDQIKVSMVLL